MHIHKQPTKKTTLILTFADIVNNYYQLFV